MTRSSRKRDSKYYNCNFNFDQSRRSVSFAASDDEYSFSDDDYESRRSNASSIYSVRKRPEKKLSFRQKRCRNLFITFMSFMVSIACGYFAVVIIMKIENGGSEPSNMPTFSPTTLESQEPSSAPTLVSSYTPSIEKKEFVSSSAPSVEKPSMESTSHFPTTSPSFTPSNFPSVIPTVQFNEVPSYIPSDSTVTNSPSIQPSQSPSQSPSVLASSTSPSTMTSAEVNRELQIMSTFGAFGDDSTLDWCLTAAANTHGSELYVKECLASNDILQVWKFTSEGQLTLARMTEGEFCVKSTFAQLTLESCGDSSDFTLINFALRNGSITQTKNSNVWRVGFDPENPFGRLQLYRNGILNESLDKWNIVYPLLSTQHPSNLPTSNDEECASTNNQEFIIPGTDMTCEDIQWYEQARLEHCPTTEVNFNCGLSCGICCFDDENFSFDFGEGSKSCDWLDEDFKTEEWCFYSQDGIFVRDACKLSCGMCREYIPVAPSASPTLTDETVR